MNQGTESVGNTTELGLAQLQEVEFYCKLFCTKTVVMSHFRVT